VNAARNILAEGLRLLAVEGTVKAEYATTTHTAAIATVKSKTSQARASTPKSTVGQAGKNACGAVVRPVKGSSLKKRAPLEGQTAVKQETNRGDPVAAAGI
jgi:hypothetical protein